MDLRERAGATGPQPHRHPWEQARLAFFARTILDDVPRAAQRPLRVLDIGAGDGWFAGELVARLPPGSQVDCWDLHYEDALLDELRASAPDGVRFFVERPEGRYDLVLLLDVIEHVEDDLGLLREVVERDLVDDGHVLVSVPAWQALFSAHDRALLHFRRYSPAQLEAVIREAGLEPLRQGGLFHSLLVPRTARKLQETVQRWRAGGEDTDLDAPPDLGQWRGGTLLTSAVLGVLRADNLVSRAAARLRVPVPGLTSWVLCRPQR